MTLLIQTKQSFVECADWFTGISHFELCNCVSLSIHVIEQCKNCREISEDKVEFVRKLRVYGVGTLRIQHA